MIVHTHIHIQICPFNLSLIPVSAKIIFPLGEPEPCNPSAETAIQPLIWCPGSRSSYLCSSPGDVFLFLTDTGITTYWQYVDLSRRVDISLWHDSVHRLSCFMILGRLGAAALGGKPGHLRQSGATVRGGEGTVDWDTVGSNCSIENRLSNFKKRISSKRSNWQIWARWGLPTVSSPILKPISQDPKPEERVQPLGLSILYYTISYYTLLYYNILYSTLV